MARPARAVTMTRNLAHRTRSTLGMYSKLYRAAPPAKLGKPLKIRARKFDGRCAKHKRYNPAVDGLGGIRGACPRCTLLFEIWMASLELNKLIRRFDPNHDD